MTLTCATGVAKAYFGKNIAVTKTLVDLVQIVTKDFKTELREENHWLLFALIPVVDVYNLSCDHRLMVREYDRFHVSQTRHYGSQKSHFGLKIKN